MFQGAMTGRSGDEAGHVVLHDWADHDARRILAACRSAMPPTAAC